MLKNKNVNDKFPLKIFLAQLTGLSNRRDLKQGGQSFIAPEDKSKLQLIDASRNTVIQ